MLAIDFRGHGESGQRQRTFGVDESLDAAAAFAWLRQGAPDRRIGVIGVSLGGAAALLGARGPLPADALILQAVYPDIRRAIRNRMIAIGGRPIGWLAEPLLSYQAPFRFGHWPGAIAPVRALGRYKGAVLVIGGADDRYTPADETHEMFAAAPGPKTLWIVPGADHGATSSLDGPDYRGTVGKFLSLTLPLRQASSMPPP